MSRRRTFARAPQNTRIRPTRAHNAQATFRMHRIHISKSSHSEQRFSRRGSSLGERARSSALVM
eukprot:763764-Prymnesium_polylepis.1